MVRKLNRWLRSSSGLLAVSGILLYFLIIAAAGQWAAWWDLGALLAGTASSTEEPSVLERVSYVSSLGVEGNLDSFAPALSGDGQYVAFLSTADNLVPDDTNFEQDVFLYDRTSNQIERITRGFDGTEANGRTQKLAFSRTGQLLAFESVASNLVEGDSNGVEDIFVYDAGADTINRISLSSQGSESNERSLQPAISGTGRYVAFVSSADNLVDGDNNEAADVFVYDRESGNLQRITINGEGQEANDASRYPDLSSDGRYIVFQSRASNLVAGDTNNTNDLFLYDRQTGVLELVSRNAQGVPGNQESQRPTISDDGRYVAFESWASDLVANDSNDLSDVFVYDRQSGQMERVSVTNEGEQATGISGGAVISSEGRYVAFSSQAMNLSEQDKNQQYDVYVFDRQKKEIYLVSVTSQGTSGNGSSISPSLAVGGRFIVFDSTAFDLVPNDSNGRVDVFLFDAGVEDESEPVVTPTPPPGPGPVGEPFWQTYLPVVTRP